MAKTNNLLVKGARGSVGKELVFKTRKNGQTFITKHPGKSSAMSSKKQAKGRNKFAQAVKFALKMLGNPAAKALIKVKAHGSLYHAAITVFMRENKSLHEILKDPRYAYNLSSAGAKHQRQEEAMDWARKHGSISNADYRKLTKTSKPTATRDLQELVKRKMLTPSGVPGPGAHYICMGSAMK